MDEVDKVALDFCDGVYDHKVKDNIWPVVFNLLYENLDNFKFDKNKIHTLWTVNGGHLRRKLSNDDLLLSILIKSMPNYYGKGLTVYRGECQFLYAENKIGFCWTPKKDVAQMFASGLNAIESGGVLLKAYAPTDAIISSPNDHSVKQMKEYEYTCNPKLLDNIEVVEIFEKCP